MKLCSKCKQNPRVVGKGKTRGSYCKQCWSDRSNTWNKENRDRVRDRTLRSKFGITLEQYNTMLTAQGGVCAICRTLNKDRKNLAVDHDHRTGKVRSLLCGNCNRGLGNFQDCPAILQRAMDYLNAA